MMKKVIAALGMAAVFAACGGKQEGVATVDTTALKQRAVAEEQARKQEAARNASPKVVYVNPPVGSSANPVSSGSGTAAEQKQGMSSRAKGALIGAGAGAIAGGLIGKNVKGAVIGGVVGAGTGYVIGRAKDKKTGRIPPKQ
jgi:hypothetical protein